jgi:hypothetical protein
MSEPLPRKPLLTAEALNDLQHAKRELMNAAVGKMPEQLVLVTAAAAVRLARREATPREVLSARIVELVRQTMKAMAREKWKPDTALLLQKRRKEGGDELAQ